MQQHVAQGWGHWDRAAGSSTVRQAARLGCVTCSHAGTPRHSAACACTCCVQGVWAGVLGMHHVHVYCGMYGAVSSLYPLHGWTLCGCACVWVWVWVCLVVGGRVGG
jgi:hypothetical protein